MIDDGKLIARKDFKKYKKGEMTKEEITACLDFARWSAAFGDKHFQQCGSDYIYEMERLGLIKNVRRDD